MSETTISHIIGTVSLMALFFVVGSYYSFSFIALKEEITIAQLEKVSNYFAADMVDLVSLCYTSTMDQLIIKKLDIPISLMGYGYGVTIFSTADRIIVTSSLTSVTSVTGYSSLPWAVDAKVHLYNQTDTEINQYIQTKQPSLTMYDEVYSSEFNIVVWCLKLDNEITIGLGILG
jgi:hypothetical protein